MKLSRVLLGSYPDMTRMDLWRLNRDLRVAHKKTGRWEDRGIIGKYGEDKRKWVMDTYYKQYELVGSDLYLCDRVHIPQAPKHFKSKPYERK